jgi:hypothetical protein
MAHDVFVSYSSQDKTAANAVCAVLEQNGIRCWIAPRDITPGERWGAAIVGAINCARAMVLGPVDKPVSAPARPERLGRRNAHVAAGGDKLIGRADRTAKKRINGPRGEFRKES